MPLSGFVNSLSLSRYARILGINPVHFVGGAPISLSDGRTLFPMNNSENDIWPRFDYQNSDLLSREELAQCISSAELSISEFLGYNVSPIWETFERIRFEPFYRPEYYDVDTFDVSGNAKTIMLPKRRFISGGVRKVTEIKLNATVTFSDPDGDGWSELGSVVVDTSGLTFQLSDHKNIKAYLSGYSDPEYEITDCKSIVVGVNTLTMKFDAWDLVDPEVQSQYPTNDKNGKSIDMKDTASYITTVAVYYEENDATQNHVIFRDDSGVSVGGGRLIPSINLDGSVTPVYSTYDATTGEWCDVSYLPVGYKYFDVKCYSGFDSTNRNTSGGYMSNSRLSPNLATAIAELTTARLPKMFLSNNNANIKMRQLMSDMLVSKNSNGENRFTPFDIQKCPFGTKYGEYSCWKRLTNSYQRYIRGGVL